ncbi:vitelline membrane protein 15a-1 [Armigeres subalbatus]|uniref:vitelline membrane protein 15a-1 n=1 Tax=Armigeres subalbatus TaxID=124917 RepID=UPI002ED02CBB
MKTVGVIASIVMIISVVAALPKAYHGHHGHAHAAPAVEYTFDAKLPQVKCGHKLLIACNPHHSVVPCNAAAAHAPAPAYHHAPAPAHHHAPAHYR